MEKKEGIVLSEDERRDFVSEQLDVFLAGENSMIDRLRKAGYARRRIPIKMELAEKHNLFNRILREPTDLIAVDLMQRLLVKPVFVEERKEADQAEPVPLSKTEVALANNKNAFLRLHFHSFDYPYDASYKKFLKKNETLMTTGSLNQVNLKNTLEGKHRLDISYLLYKTQVMRFLVLDPIPLSAKGFIGKREK